MYDITVVGAGPIGSHLARKFAEQGHEVLLLEKGKVGKPLKGTGHVSKDIFDHVPEKDKFVEKEIHGAVVHNNGSSFSFGRDRHTSYVLDRVEFDRYMAKRARKVGADFRRERFIDMKTKKGKVTVKTDSEEYETKLLAGCDGPLSDVRVAAELSKPELFLHGIFTNQIEVGPIQQNHVEVFLDTSEGFFGWKVPRKESFEYGLAVELGKDSRTYLEDFAKKEGFNISQVYSGMIPMLPPEKVTKNRVFLCGDAAGQTKPFSGGGLIYGLTAAEIAAETVDPEKPTTLEQYEEGWREELMGEIKTGNRIRKLYGLPSFLRYPFLWLGKHRSKHAHMDRPKSLLGYKK